MTLPFRGRHNDAEATHDRARALSSRRLVEPLHADEDAWLDRHLEACTECRREDEAFVNDHELLRSLRDTPIEPPRDLWARTAAALDVAAAGRSPRRTTSARPSWRGVPVAAAAGVVVLLVVVGTALLPGVIPSNLQPSNPIAAVSLPPGATPIPVAAARIRLLRPAADGTFDFVYTDVDAVCPRARPECVPPPAEHEGSSLNLAGARASTLTLSPNNNQLVFESEGGTATEGKIYIVPVTASAQPSAPTATATATATSTPSAAESTPPSSPPVSAEPTPGATPFGQVEIASGVTIVGDVAYSPDGQWLAFSAQPKDGSTGPDLYLYGPGSATAVAVTSDHQSYFSAWLGSQVLASDVVVTTSDAEAPGNSKGSPAPAGSGKGNEGQGGGGNAIEGRASSFLLDPATGTRTDLLRADVWMPVADPTGRFVAYWSGSLRSADGVTWQLGEGALVLDRWVGDASSIGPAGQPTPIVTSHVEDFVARFDPDGIRLAVWVSEHAGSTDGRLHLLVIEPSTGTIASEQPLPGEPALRRFSIGANRLAWVSPSGQDGHESSLQVLGWRGDVFGQIHSEPAPNLLIVR
jgi:WD40 repeat protein